jgi:predicted NUDIX family NTP pyrophosphohydrolase
VLLFRRTAGSVEVLLVHPGGPFWRGKDVGAWQIPKGEIEAGEEPEAAARREAREELGVAIDMPLTPLGEVRQAGGKRVEAFAGEGALDADAVVSNTVEIDWPPRSGRRITVPEIDTARWLSLADAARLMLPSQLPLLERVADLLGARIDP